MGSTTGKCEERWLSEDEHAQAHLYILTNCGSFMKPYEKDFEAHIMYSFPDVTTTNDVWSKHDKSFPIWLRGQVDRLDDPFIKALAYGPSKWVRTWRRYSINGYYFRTFKDGYDVYKSTMSNGVCVTSTEGLDYYGFLNKIVELTYSGTEMRYKSVLFKCDWIDNSSKGQAVHDVYQLIDVNPKLKLRGHNPFVLAYQVDQVCYAPYPSTNKENQWRAVFKIKPRSQIDAPLDETFYQEDHIITNHDISPIVVEEDQNEEHYVVVLEGDEEEVDAEEGELGEEDEGLQEQHDEDGEDEDEQNLFSDDEHISNDNDSDEDC